MTKPFAQSAENNKGAILDILKLYAKDGGNLLEIGSGTGQHICYFAKMLPTVKFFPSELEQNIPGIEKWIAETRCQNIKAPRVLDVNQTEKLSKTFDIIFSANTAHIMSMSAVTNMFKFASQHLIQDGFFLLYGPFNKDGHYTSKSNERFDQNLKELSPEMGLRCLTDLKQIANNFDLTLTVIHAMPTNNLILSFKNN